jgi:hypothetical protein
MARMLTVHPSKGAFYLNRVSMSLNQPYGLLLLAMKNLTLHNLHTLCHDRDPKITKKTAIVGMFVLRPAKKSWKTPIFNDKNKLESLYDQTLDWCYNVDLLNGGGTVANHNAVDAYRLCMQYALADAVIVGSNTVCCEGVGPDAYLWQHYAVCQWNQLKNEKGLSERLLQQRSEFQKLGYLSSRRYPAQIIFTWSGEHYAGSPDFLEVHTIFTCSS